MEVLLFSKLLKLTFFLFFLECIIVKTGYLGYPRVNVGYTHYIVHQLIARYFKGLHMFARTIFMTSRIFVIAKIA